MENIKGQPLHFYSSLNLALMGVMNMLSKHVSFFLNIHLMNKLADSHFSAIKMATR
jgi:hypothetical protein